jgi:uncharacterized protein YdcH (DUF465 family)
MNAVDRLECLKDKHKKLKQLIEAAEAEKAPSDYVTKLKKEKLLLKDEIAELERTQ